MGHRERVRAACSCTTDTLSFTASLRLQIYRGLGIEPILDDRGELDRVLVGQWPYSVRLSVQLSNLSLTESSSHDIHVVKFGNGTPDGDLVEQVWKLMG